MVVGNNKHCVVVVVVVVMGVVITDVREGTYGTYAYAQGVGLRMVSESDTVRLSLP